RARGDGAEAVRHLLHDHRPDPRHRHPRDHRLAIVASSALVRLMTIATPKPDALLDSGFMARLDQLDVMSRKLLAGKMKGERRSKRRGQSVEFADYRNYVVGDDLRFIDWNIYARLDRLFLKLFLEEEDLSLYVIIDVSKS